MKYTDAKKIACDVCKALPNGEEKDTVVYYAIQAAMAGAKWMAEQGESIESTVVTTQDEDTCHPYLALQNFGYVPAPVFCKEGDKVIVQIRKKEE